MSPLQILRKCSDLNVQINIDGGGVVLRAKYEQLTESLITTVAEYKAQLLKELGELADLANDEWPEILGNPHDLKVYCEMSQITKMREKGEVPHHYTATTICMSCGPVPIWEGCEPKVVGCPWCLNRAAGRPLPRVIVDQS